MKYYLIAGEASGDLHASRLMKSLREVDKDADFRFFGGDLMARQGGTRVRHYRDTAFMGVLPVILHLPTILHNLSFCKADIAEWHPDAVILVDYPGFNLRISKYVREHIGVPVFYYIAPKIWAWKEFRIRQIKRDVSRLFSILPFEVDFFEKKHGYPIDYVGNPTVEEVEAFKKNRVFPPIGFCDDERLSELPLPAGDTRPVIALLAGSRRHEINDNLPGMLEAVGRFGNYRPVVAGAPGIDPAFYDRFTRDGAVEVVYGKTYELLSQSVAALVTSGTATLETALFEVPQVVCYRMRLARLMSFLRKHFLRVKYVSLVNLIAGTAVVPELVAADFSVDRMAVELARILPGGEGREPMLKGYRQVREALGGHHASQEAAMLIRRWLHKE